MTNHTPGHPRSRSISLTFPVLALVLSVGIASLWMSGCQFPVVVKETVPPIDHPSVGAKLAPTMPVMGSPAAPVLDPNTPGFLKMNHYSHVVDQEMTCDGCHEISDSGQPGMPDHDTCSVCHDINVDEPDAECMFCHVLSPESIAAEEWMDVEVKHAPEKEGFKFDHTAFADDYDSCVTCHSGVTGSNQSTDNLRGTHETLFPGLRKAGLDTNNCALCHSDMNKNVPPASHMQPNFRQAHGGMYAADPNLCMTCHTQNQCDTCHQNTQPQSHFKPEWVHAHGKVGVINEQACLMCHTEQACQTCHQQMMPKDHTNFFRRRSHGKIASWDRERCLVCHKQDYCEACHIGSAPIAFAAPFHTPGAPCLQCHSPASAVAPVRRHGPLPQDSCLNCHRLQ
jgi:hypothetical protein